jgi:hypothetical protein
MNMKYIILAILSLFILLSCSIVKVDLDCLPVLNSYNEEAEWVHTHIDYEYDERIAPIEETVKTGKGDCKDRALVFLALAYKNQGVRGELVLWNTPLGEHCTALVNGYNYGYIAGSHKIGAIGYNDAMRLQGYVGPIYLW